MNKNILLIAPTSNITSLLTPDVGLGFVASALRAGGFEPLFIDMKRDAMSVSDIINNIRKKKYTMVGVKIFSSFLPEANELMDAIKKELPQTKIVIGGPHPSFAFEEALDTCPSADVAVMGDGEDAVVQIANAFNNGSNLGEIEAISYRENGKVKINAKRAFLDMEKAPIPAWDLMDPRWYSGYHPFWFLSRGKNIANISVSRGCPFQCIFCSDFMVSGHKVRYRKLDDVIDEIKMLTGQYEVDEINIIDSIFTINRKYAYEFSNRLVRENIKVEWATPYGTRLDTLDEELLQAMESAGCYGTAVGIESGSSSMLEFMKKGISKEKIREKVNFIKEVSGIMVSGTFIIGFPTETKEQMQETIDFACELPLDMAVFNLFRPTPGTWISGYMRENDPTAAQDWVNITLEAASYTPQGMTREELLKWYRKAYRSFYFRPKIFWNYLHLLKRRQQITLVLQKLKTRFFRKTVCK